jgi:TatA/E family protein of Tat protein translocase
MFGGIGMPELIVIFVIALVIFGPKKLPDLGKSLGEAIRGFRKAMNDSDRPPLESTDAQNDTRDSSKPA